MPYKPKITVMILPTIVVATTSPKPIVVTTAKLYHKASPNEPNPASAGSIAESTIEKQTIIVSKPKMISSEKVDKIIFAKTLNLSDDKAIREASTNETIAIKTHSTVMTDKISASPLPVEEKIPDANETAKTIIATLNMMLLKVCFLMISKIRETMIVTQNKPPVKENRYGTSTANNVVTPKATLIINNTNALIKLSFVLSFKNAIRLITPMKTKIQTRYLGASE